jgi:integrase
MEVQGKLLDLQQRKKTGSLTETSKVTVAQYLERWLNDTSRLTVRESTHRRYAELVRVHINPQIGGVRLHRLTAPDVQNIFSTMEEKGLSPRTRQFVFDVVSMALDQAVKLGLVIRNVCDQLTRPKVPKRDMLTLDAHQAAVFLKAAQSDRLWTMYVLALTVGMRQGELFALQWSSVSLDAGRLSVRHTLCNGKLGPPKTSKSRRQIELPAIAVGALWQHKAAMLAEGHASSPFVFCNTRGGNLSSQNFLRRSFLPILKAADLPRIRFHDLRHTAATLMLSEGINAKVVSETLGHATVAFTLDTYAHVLPSMGRDAANRMNRLFSVAT